MENKGKKARFIERLLAYFIDFVVVVILSTILSYPFTANSVENVQKISSEMDSLTEQFYSNEIDAKTYMLEAPSLSYELSKVQGATTLITIFIYIMYYIVFQFYNKGQTIGKKLLKIKVVSNNGDLTMNQLILRELLIYNILIAMIEVTLMSFNVGSFTYFYVVGTLEFIQIIFVLISVFMIMFSKNTRGLHDCIVKTDVVKI